MLEKQLLNTFQVAAILKLIGTLTAMGLSFALTNDWALNRWWMGLLTSSLLVVWLAPWRTWQNEATADTLLRIALGFALLAPHLDLVQSLWVPFETLPATAQFLTQLGWSEAHVYTIHALGQLFIMVPVVLASWHYGRGGMLVTLGTAGLLYLITALVLPAHAVPLLVYAVRGFVLLGVTLILAYTVYRLAESQRQQTAKLQAANDQLTAQALTLETLATSRERNRLARELHDTLAHALSGTAVQLQAVGTLLTIDPQTAKTELREAQNQIKQGLTESRRAIAALRDSSLESLGLVEALRQRGKNIAQRSGFAFESDVQIAEQAQPLPLHIEQSLFRMADEALLNTEKHAAATAVTLSVAHTSEKITLVVRDNGRGFDPQQTAPQAHFGLMGLRERAALIGAHLDIHSRPNHDGTTVTINWQIPIMPIS